MIVLDTHCWLWWLSDPKQLSRAARAAIQRSVARNEALVSAISVLEVAMLVARGRLELSMALEEWIAQAESLSGFRFIAIDNRIALRAVQLPGEFHSDPADRIIVATALARGAGLATKDERMRRYPHVRCVW